MQQHLKHPPTCLEPLCEALFPDRVAHMEGMLLRLWHTDSQMRAAWCKRVGVNQAHLERMFPPGGPDLPPLVVQAMNLAKSAASHIAAGMPEASPEEQNRRESLCRGCEKYRPSDDRCAACGCYVKEKTSWQLEMCPLGKW